MAQINFFRWQISFSCHEIWLQVRFGGGGGSSYGQPLEHDMVGQCTKLAYFGKGAFTSHVGNVVLDSATVG